MYRVTIKSALRRTGELSPAEEELAYAGQRTGPMRRPATSPPGASAPLREPGRAALRVLLGTAGLVSLGLFCAPQQIAATGALGGFAWEGLSDLAGMALAERLCLAGGGAALLAVALLPLPYRLRALLALLLALAPLGLRAGQTTWRTALVEGGVLLLAGALFLRAYHRPSRVARVGIVLGVAALWAPLLAPRAGAIPLLSATQGLGSLATIALAAKVWPLVLGGTGLLALLALRGAHTGGLARVWAVALLLVMPIGGWLLGGVSLAAGHASLAPILGATAAVVYVAVAALAASQLVVPRA